MTIVSGELEPHVAEAVRIADHYLAGAPAEYRKQCAKEILAAIIQHAFTIAMDAIGVAGEKLELKP